MHNPRRENNSFELLKTKYILFVICFTFLLYQSIDLLNEFMSGKTVTTITYGIIRNTTLPAITICPHDLDYRKLAMLNENVSILYVKYIKNISNLSRKDIEVMENNYLNYYRALEIFFNSNKSNFNINNDILDNLTPFNNQTNNRTLYSQLQLSYPYGNIENDLSKIDNYSYRIISLPMESLMITINKTIPFVYKCYTLFSHSHSSWNNIYVDFKYMKMSLKLDRYSMPIKPTQPIRIMMHSQNSLPYENLNIISPGYFYIIEYSQWNIERLGKGYDTDCREYNPKEYTRSDCIFDCYQDKVKYHCETKDFVGSTFLRRRIYFEQDNLNLTKCIVANRIYFELIKLCEVRCRKECHFTYYSFTISKLAEFDMYQANFIINHNEMPDITIRYIPEMPLLTFICNFGGILGMWLGISFYSIVEIIWKILRIKILSMNFFQHIVIKTKNKFIITQNGNSRRVTPSRIH